MNFWQSLPKPFTVLAPMEEVTDVVFRSLINDLGRPDVFFTEFTNCEGMQSKGRESVGHRLKFNENQQPVVAQIWGSKPDTYFKTAQEIVEMGFSGIDINMGCPVLKITNHGSCSALIKNPALAVELIAAVREAVDGKIPVSVKTRVGFNKTETEAWCGLLLDQNLDALTIHGRIAKELSKFPADWTEIQKVVEMRNSKNLSTIVIGNGDVESLEQVKQKHIETGVDGVMIGRGVFKDPFVFNPDKSIKDLDLHERFALLLKHANLFVDTWGNKKNFHILRRFFKIYVSDFDGVSEIRTKLMQTNNLEDVLAIGREYQLL